jgi:hypothetical protein
MMTPPRALAVMTTPSKSILKHSITWYWVDPLPLHHGLIQLPPQRQAAILLERYFLLILQEATTGQCWSTHIQMDPLLLSCLISSKGQGRTHSSIASWNEPNPDLFPPSSKPWS